MRRGHTRSVGNDSTAIFRIPDGFSNQDWFWRRVSLEANDDLDKCSGKPTGIHARVRLNDRKVPKSENGGQAAWPLQDASCRGSAPRRSLQLTLPSVYALCVTPLSASLRAPDGALPDDDLGAQQILLAVGAAPRVDVCLAASRRLFSLSLC